MKNKLLIICGPTSTGKTDLGIYLAKKFSGEIISADSRQVYKELTIGSGKKYSHEVTIHGYDLAPINEDFSVSHFRKYALEKIADIHSRKKLPIVVGGTGFYIKSILEEYGSLDVPVNKKLRNELSELNAEELYQKLFSLSIDKAESLNESDRRNPRRLVRAIEVLTSTVPQKNNNFYLYDNLIIGLTAPLATLTLRVNESIDQRLKIGFEDEVRDVLKYLDTSQQALSATGYKEFQKYFSGEISKDAAISLWKISERQYVKRQMTWFNKMKNVKWVDILDTNFKKQVEELVQAWNNK